MKRKPYKMTAKHRKALSAAQKKRWQDYRKEKAAMLIDYTAGYRQAVEDCINKLKSMEPEART